MTRKIESAIALIALVAGCAHADPQAAETPGVTPPSSSQARLDFEFDSLDERAASSQATRGKPTFVTFVQTGSIKAQAEVEFLVAMSKHDGEQTNYLLVVLEPRSNREIVEAYVKAIGVPFPVAFADAATMSGEGPFGEIHDPTTVLLDRVGRVVWRADGRIAKSEELRAQMRGL